jgi:hypothetical protein
VLARVCAGCVLAMAPAYAQCWRRVCHMALPCTCVCGCASKKNIFFWAVWLRPLTNLEIPFGAGACTLELCRFIWCGEYRSAVKVSTCNTTPPPKTKYITVMQKTSNQPSQPGSFCNPAALSDTILCQAPGDPLVGDP